jgi:two-component system cell cycle sensor histidine kinase/response regulator CckA
MILRVLVVDDEEPMRLFVGRVLRDAGHEVAMAVNGDDAIAMLPALTGLDVLVTDEVMPRMPGHELARLVRAREPAVRVLYLTGFSDQLFKEKRAMWAGEAFLEKPCSAKALLEAVSQLLRGDLETDS